MTKQPRSRHLSLLHVTGQKTDWMESTSNMVVATEISVSAPKRRCRERHTWFLMHVHAYTCTHAYINMFYMHRIKQIVLCDGHWLREEGFCLVLFIMSLLNGYEEMCSLFFNYCNPPCLSLLAVQSPQILFAWMPCCHPKAEITCLGMGQDGS